MVNQFVHQLLWRVVRHYRLQLRSPVPNAHLLYVDRDLNCKQHFFQSSCRLKLKSVKTMRKYDYILTVTRAEVSPKPLAINLDIIISFRLIVFRKKQITLTQSEILNTNGVATLKRKKLYISKWRNLLKCSPSAWLISRFIPFKVDS